MLNKILRIISNRLLMHTFITFKVNQINKNFLFIIQNQVLLLLKISNVRRINYIKNKIKTFN